MSIRGLYRLRLWYVGHKLQVYVWESLFLMAAYTLVLLTIYREALSAGQVAIALGILLISYIKTAGTVTTVLSIQDSIAEARQELISYADGQAAQTRLAVRDEVQRDVRDVLTSSGTKPLV